MTRVPDDAMDDVYHKGMPGLGGHPPAEPGSSSTKTDHSRSAPPVANR